jgi:pimeloyl-ACP methyl ester carboxylesterase
MPTFPSTDGVEVAAYELGGAGPPLFFAHATGFHGHIWMPIVDRLQDAFTCYSFDTRGHGDSSAPADGVFDWRAFADDALAAVDGFALDRPFAVGHSAGGALLLLAEQARPGTFRSLYLYEPIVYPAEGPPPASENPLAAGARRRREVFASREAAYENYAGKTFSVFTPEALQAYVDYAFDDLPDGTVRLKCRGENEARTYDMSLHHGAYAGLAEVACPVTLACGSDTDAIGPAFIDILAARLPDVRTQVFDGLGHFGPMQDPAAVADAIRAAFT